MTSNILGKLGSPFNFRSDVSRVMTISTEWGPLLRDKGTLLPLNIFQAIYHSAQIYPTLDLIQRALQAEPR